MKARLHLLLTEPDGTIVGERRARNTVMASGAQLIADLFAGRGSPITHMGVGTSDLAPDDVTVAALTNGADGGDPALTGEIIGAIAQDAFSATLVEARRVVQVRVRGTLPAAAAIGRIRESGLMSQSASGSVLYNRVVFPPLDKRDDHELTLFWEVEFPFGDLQWLT
jgi:hypothetical protein